MKSRLLLAYGSVPKDGGTFTFYRTLRPYLERRDIETLCVTVGAQQQALWDDRFADNGCVLLCPKENNLERAAKVFAGWCEDKQVDFVMPINSFPIIAAVPHLPTCCHIVGRCANSVDYGYRRALAGWPRVAKVVATTPRHMDDLRSHYGVEDDHLILIPHGLDPTPFEVSTPETKGTRPELTIGFIGRFEHNDKGTMFLPPLAQLLSKRGVPFRMVLAGRGPHEQQLRRALKTFTSTHQVQFIGSVPPTDVPAVLRNIDVFVFPSRNEGFGFALVEAMAAGCAVVSSLIPGVTDFVLQDGESGLLFPVGDVAAMAQAVEGLHRDRSRLRRLGETARQAVLEDVVPVAAERLGGFEGHHRG